MENTNQRHLKEQLKINQNLVSSFEKEFESKITSFHELEKDVDKLSNMRNQWLQGLTTLDIRESYLFNQKLQLLRVKTEKLSAELMTDIVRLEGYYEAQTLNYLIQVTNPLEKDEIVEFERNEYEANKLAILHKNIAKLKQSIKDSIKLRSSLVSSIVSMQTALDRMKIEYKSNYELTIQRIQHRLMEFIALAEKKLNKSKVNHKAIMSDYLILRHNARIAQERLTKSKNRALEERFDLQQQFQKFAIDMTNERVLVEGSAREELKLVIDDMRKKLLYQEYVMEDMERKVCEKENEAKGMVNTLQSELKRYDDKYNELQEKRVWELKNMGKDVKKLRDMIRTAEIQGLYPQTS